MPQKREFINLVWPPLFKAIGHAYDVQINPTTGAAWAAPSTTDHVRVPDFRGIFLRSAGTNALGQTTTLGGWQDDATAVNNLKAKADIRSAKAMHPAS